MREKTWKEEARAHDRKMSQRNGNVPKLSPKQIKKIEQDREKAQKLRDVEGRNSNLEKFFSFDLDPLEYIKELVAQGDFGNRNEKLQLFTLMSLIKIQRALESPDLNKLSRK